MSDVITKVIGWKYCYPIAVAVVAILAITATWMTLTSFIPGLTVSTLASRSVEMLSSLDDSYRLWTNGYFVRKYGTLVAWVAVIVVIATVILVGQSRAENAQLDRERNN